MPRGRKASPEQIVVTLRQIEVQLAQGKSLAQACKEAGIAEQSRDRRLARPLQPCIGTPIWLCHWREEVLLIGTRSRGVFGVPSGSLCDGLSAG